MSNLKILMAASEAVPFLRTGDVANVVTGLSLALRAEGHDARVIIPYYRNLTFGAQPKLVLQFSVPLADFSRDVSLWRVDYVSGDASVPVYLLKHEFYFDREHPYGYLDDYERFVFFSRAIVEIFKTSGLLPDAWRPQVIHGHDWVVGLLPSWMRHTYQEQFTRDPLAFVYNIHNAGFQGLFSYRAIALAGLQDLGIYRQQFGETANRINFMARGVLAADAVNTVSYEHAKEIKKVWYARDLARALAWGGKPFIGILNGLDYAIYDPSLDKEISPFNSDTLSRRRQNKTSAQHAFGLQANPQASLLGMVSRLIAEKGMDLLEKIVPQLMDGKDYVQIVVVGEAGDYRYQEVFDRFAERYQGKFAVTSAPDDSKLRKLFGGADLILVPSLYDPCGLQQIIAMRYGAIPVVHRTGGLMDTVRPLGALPSGGEDRAGKGFVFEPYDPNVLLQTIHHALDLLRNDSKQWRDLQRYNMEVPNYPRC